jgi:outer membrane lipoprotein SlyB
VRGLLVLAILAACALVAGCAQNRPAEPPAGEERDVRMGVVEEVRRVPLPASSGGFVGTLGGATAGGIAGGSVGSGRGRQASSAVGAIAGSVAGRALESAVSATEGLEISIRLDSGSVILVLQPDGETFKPGERVRVSSGARGTLVTH